MILAGIYVAADNTIIWGTDHGLYKWDIATKAVVASLPIPAAGMSRSLGLDGLFVNGVAKIDPVSMTVVAPLTIGQFTLPHGPDDFRTWPFNHQYDAATNSLFLMDDCGNVQRLDLRYTGNCLFDMNGDANPALVIYDILTNEVWGLRKPAGTIDASSFDAAARTLASEGLGMSQTIDTPNNADSILSDILR